MAWCLLDPPGSFVLSGGSEILSGLTPKPQTDLQSCRIEFASCRSRCFQRDARRGADVSAVLPETHRLRIEECREVWYGVTAIVDC